jgi:hypothetical protein
MRGDETLNPTRGVQDIPLQEVKEVIIHPAGITAEVTPVMMVVVTTTRKGDIVAISNIDRILLSYAQFDQPILL